MLTNTVDILIVDDHRIVLDAFTSLLESANFNIVAVAESSQSALDMYKEHKPDITIMDISMPGQSGLVAIDNIINFDSKAKIIICTMYNEIQIIANAFRGGALGFVNKSDPLIKLIEAINKVHRGQYYLDDKYCQAIALMDDINISKYGKNSSAMALKELSSKEFEIFRMVAKGMNTREVADCMALSSKTVANYRSRILSKLGLNSSQDLTILAMNLGIIQ